MDMFNKRILLIVSLIVSAAGSVTAQTGTAGTSNSTASKPDGKLAEASKRLGDGNNDNALEYLSSLQGLASLYEADFKRLTEQNAKLKDLFDKGLVSRRELEQSDKSVADARAKIEQTSGEITSAKAKPKRTDMLANMISTPNSDLAWSTGNKQVDGLIHYYGRLYGVDPYLIYCVMNQESGFSTAAISPKGAQGLMQLMPDTAARYGVTRLADPSQNIMAGTRYLKDLQKLFGRRIDLVLAAYNAGEGAVMRYGNRVPPYQETKNYVRSIIARYAGSGQSGAATKTAL
jgi:soluble lytic murein transglycosylase-like protein